MWWSGGQPIQPDPRPAQRKPHGGDCVTEGLTGGRYRCYSRERGIDTALWLRWRRWKFGIWRPRFGIRLDATTWRLAVHSMWGNTFVWYASYRSNIRDDPVPISRHAIFMKLYLLFRNNNLIKTNFYKKKAQWRMHMDGYWAECEGDIPRHWATIYQKLTDLFRTFGIWTYHVVFNWHVRYEVMCRMIWFFSNCEIVLCQAEITFYSIIWTLPLPYNVLIVCQYISLKKKAIYV